MTSRHPFRFGIQAHHTADGSEWMALARRAEALGYSTLTMPDHFDEQFAIGPALGAAAAVTSTLRLGTMVYGVDYRHPAVLAKEVATIDVLSGGRFEFGLGAGWMTADYERTGMTLDPPGTRIERMVETLEVVRRMLAGGPVDHDGDHVSVRGLVGSPTPVQRPCPPVMLGGGGPRMLRTAARHADIVGVNLDLRGGAIGPDLGSDAAPARVDEKLAWVRDGAGERFDDIELHLRVFVAQLSDDRRGVAEAVADGFGMSVEDALASPYAAVGTVDEVCESLIAHRDRWGFSYISFGPEVMEDFSPVVERLAGT